MMRTALGLLFLTLSACGARFGDPCTTHGECRSLKYGYCAKALICTRPCGAQTPTPPLSGTTLEETQCPSGSACVRRGIRQVCLATCETAADCPQDFSCVGGLCELTSPFSAAPKT
jgi:hypothetical protein